MRSKLTLALVGCLLVGIALTLLPFIHSGLSETHDGEGHVARAANYATALKQGQVPPRWAPYFWNGFGYPVFNFYYPLLNILAAPIIIIGVHPELAIKACLAAGVLLLVASWVLIGKRQGSTTAGLFAACSFLLSPYFFNLLSVRGAFGEFAAYVAVSFLLLAVARAFDKPSRWWLLAVFLGSSALALAHNLMALVLLPPLAFFLVRTAYVQRSRLPILVSFVLGISVSSFFWIPVFFEKPLVVLDDIPNDYTQHFATLSQLLYDKVEQGISQAGTTGELSLSVGTLTIAIICLALWKTRKNIRGLNWHLSILASMLFLTLPLSAVIWQHVPALSYLQFPWRWLGPVMLVAASLNILVWKKMSTKVRWGLVALVLILLADRFFWPLRASVHHPAEYYFLYTQTSTVQDELRPRTWQVPTWTVSTNQPTLNPTGQYQIAKWRGSYRKYQITTTDPTVITEPTMYFPGWETRLDGQKITIDPTRAQGQISFTVPAGHHTIETRFTQNTPARLAGNTISVLTLLTSGLLFLLTCNRRTPQTSIRGSSFSLRH